MIVCPWKDIGRYASVIPGLEEAVKAINALESLEPATHPLSDGNRFMVQAGTTKPAEGRDLEAHRRYLDIQYILEGKEVVGWAPLETLTPAAPFNEEKDVGMFSGACDYMEIQAGYCYVAFPEDAHKPGSHITEPNDFRKIVVKLKV